MCINKLNIAIMNLREHFNKFLITNSGILNFSTLGEFEYINNDYSTSFEILTFADDKKARRKDLENIGKYLRNSIEKYKMESNGKG
jgi:hypothetical protein